MSQSSTDAPGWPGIQPTWTSSAKAGVGTALSPASRVWFTLSHGIVDEVYYPRVDQACTRDLGLIITDGRSFFSEEKRSTDHQILTPEAGVPLFQLKNRCERGYYTIEKEILADPDRDVLLQQIRFQPHKGELADFRLYVLLAPHLANHGSGNTGWLGDYKGYQMLLAQRGSAALALASSAQWLKRSVGYVGMSDAWQDLHQHKQLLWEYARAENGNVALVGEIDLVSSQGSFTLALGFGLTASEAGYRALASLQTGYGQARRSYVSAWQGWQASLRPPRALNAAARDLFQRSAFVLRSHEAKRFPGGIIASLSIPWGFSKGDDDLGGYHLVWPRDLAEAAGALLAAGAQDEARRVLEYLETTQEPDGHWPQNMWLDGTPYWAGIQMDETAFPILLVDLAQREGALTDGDTARFWPMVRKAAEYLVRHGPITEQDRWEEDPGYSPFTLAVEIAALVVAAEVAERHGERGIADYMRETADAWNDNIERWTFVSGTPLAERLGVEGYFIRIAPPEAAEAASPKGGFVPIKNRAPGQSEAPADQILSPDALALVRFGLRSPHDPRILSTVKAIDAQLRIETPYGPAWHRYSGDGYGEHQDGSPFDGEGIGRAWPLLTGERAHYELAAGRRGVAKRFLKALIGFANRGGLLPEQVWDQPDLPKKELSFGRATGSAMPLVWAHAEYLKLTRSLQDNRVFDLPPAAAERYAVERRGSPLVLWRPNLKVRQIPQGKQLRVETFAPTVIRWRQAQDPTYRDLPSQDTGMGVWKADLPTPAMPLGVRLQFQITGPVTQGIDRSEYEVEIVVPG